MVVVHVSTSEDKEMYSIISSEFCINHKNKSIRIINRETTYKHKDSFPVPFDKTITNINYRYIEYSNDIIPSQRLLKSKNIGYLTYVHRWINTYTFQLLTNNNLIFPSCVSVYVKTWIDAVVSGIDLPDDILQNIKEYLYCANPTTKNIDPVSFNSYLKKSVKHKVSCKIS